MARSAVVHITDLDAAVEVVKTEGGYRQTVYCLGVRVAARTLDVPYEVARDSAREYGLASVRRWRGLATTPTDGLTPSRESGE